MTLQATIPFETEPPSHVTEDEVTWRDLASCRDTDTLMVGEHMTDTDVQLAKAVCAGCPVWFDCLAYSIVSSSPYGVFGGMSADERARWKKRPNNRRLVAEWRNQQILNIRAARYLSTR